MSDNQQEPCPAEVYANVRNRALEEAAIVLDEMRLCAEDEAYDNVEARKVGEGTTWNMAVDRASGRIRALKTEPK